MLSWRDILSSKAGTPVWELADLAAKLGFQFMEFEGAIYFVCEVEFGKPASYWQTCIKPPAA